MGSYKVLEPMGFMRGDVGVTCWPGAVVEVGADQAKVLVAEGKLEPVKGFAAKAAPVVDRLAKGLAGGSPAKPVKTKDE